MKGLHSVSFVLLIVGGLNWLLFALAKTDIGVWLGGMEATPARVIYVLVGLAAVYEIFTHRERCKACGT